MTTRVRVEPGACGFECRMEIRFQCNECVFIKVTSKCEKVVAFAKALSNLEIKEFLAPAHKNRIMKAAGISGCHPSCLVPMAVIKGVEVEHEIALPKTAMIELERI